MLTSHYKDRSTLKNSGNSICLNRSVPKVWIQQRWFVSLKIRWRSVKRESCHWFIFLVLTDVKCNFTGYSVFDWRLIWRRSTFLSWRNYWREAKLVLYPFPWLWCSEFVPIRSTSLSTKSLSHNVWLYEVSHTRQQIVKVSSLMFPGAVMEIDPLSCNLTTEPKAVPKALIYLCITVSVSILPVLK